MTDKEITALYFARSERAIEETRSAYGGLVRHVIRCILSGAQDIEECESDTYLAAWQSIPPNEPRSLGAYLSRIARNTACKRLEYLTAGKRHAETLPIDELAYDFGAYRLRVLMTKDCTAKELTALQNAVYGAMH